MYFLLLVWVCMYVGACACQCVSVCVCVSDLKVVPENKILMKPLTFS